MHCVNAHRLNPQRRRCRKHFCPPPCSQAQDILLGRQGQEDIHPSWRLLLELQEQTPKRLVCVLNTQANLAHQPSNSA